MFAFGPHPSARTPNRRVGRSCDSRRILGFVIAAVLSLSGCYAYEPCRRSPWWGGGGGGGGCGCGGCGQCCGTFGANSGGVVCGPVIEGATASAPVYADNGEPYTDERAKTPTVAANRRNSINANRKDDEEQEPAFEPRARPSRPPRPTAKDTNPK